MIASVREHLTISVYGLSVRVAAPDRQLLALMTERLPPGWEPSTGAHADRVYELCQDASDSGLEPRLLINGGPAAHRAGLDGVLDAVGADSQAHVAEMAPGRVFVHAGVVGWRGRAVMIPGSSWSGKTTLVAELVRAGATYYSDEYAVLDDSGFVHPYPQPLAIREPERRLRLAPSALGGTVGCEPLRVGLVVVSTYREGAVWRPTRLTAGRAMLALITHTVSFRRQPEAALQALREIVACATVLEGERGSAAELARQLLDDDLWIDRRPAAPCS